MTTTVSQEAVEVTQADREAAASVAVLVEMRELILSGRADHHATPFARHRQQAERETLARMEAEIERLREALDEIRDLHVEINPCNYDHDDACELNRQFCYAITVADTALNPPAPEAGQ